IRLKFKIKAPKFNIDSLFVKYTISDSITIKSDSNKIFTSIPFEYRRIIRDSIITSIIFNPDLDSIRFDSIFNNNTTKVNFDIISVYKGAKCYNRDSIRKEIPINVLTIIDNKNNTENPYFDETIYRDLIIREQINPNFSSQEATVKNSIENYYKVLDTLVYSYIHYNRL
ncbi:MAG: hypothetical protein Q4B21_06540, partial [Bacteroidia bacterium]|nr:hypothetical protein [Bacteroidia bacterium]